MIHGRTRLEGKDLCLTPIGPGEAVFLIGSFKWSDYDLTLKAITNSQGGFNILFHWTAPGTFYAFCPGSVNNRYADLHRKQETLSERAPGQLRFGRLEPDRWYDLHLEVRGSFYHCYVDGKEWFQTQDESYAHGKVGLGVTNSNNRFRDIKVTAPDGTVMWNGPPDLSNLPRFALDRTRLPITPLAKNDLLAQTEPDRDTLSGTWSMSQGSLNSAAAAAQIEFPYSPAGDYDYRVTFLRTVGESPIAMIFPVDGRMCDWAVLGPKRTTSGFGSFSGSGFDGNQTTNRFNRMQLENGERHTLVIAVRGHAILAYIDGVQMNALRIDQDHMALDPSIVPLHGNCVGLRIGGDAVTVESADILPVAASATTRAAPLRAGRRLSLGRIRKSSRTLALANSLQRDDFVSHIFRNVPNLHDYSGDLR